MRRKRECLRCGKKRGLVKLESVGDWFCKSCLKELKMEFSRVKSNKKRRKR